MPQQTKIFRVFVSSTFTDMKQERSLLQKDVFPRLEKFCEQNNAKFQAVDLRWGVTEESQLNQKTLQICLNEVARCQRISPKPNFLILLGDKYGWQPIPEKIPESEWEDIFTLLTGKDASLLNQWYRKDSNAVPTEYVLQPRGKEYNKYSKWEPIHDEIRKVLRDAVSQLKFTEEQKIKYFTSATHQEILNGALNPPPDIEDPKKHVFAFVRQANIKPKDKTADGFIDLIGDVHDAEADLKLSSLKNKLKENLKDNYTTYSANWKNHRTEIEDAAAYAENVFEKLKAVIEEQLKNLVDPDEITHEQRLHKDFKEKLVQHFRGRQDTLNKINDYLNKGTDNKILSLIGESGSGKSSVMAKVIQEFTKPENMENAVVVYRFLGTTSNSSNVITLMQSVAGQITLAFDTELKELAGEGNEKALYEMYGMTEVFRKCLTLATTKKPIVVFLDALDQLSDTDNALSLYWLPKELPENVKLIVSSLPELEGNLSDTQTEHLPLLPESEAKDILHVWFNSISRKLTESQYLLVMGKFKTTPLPIYLKLVFEQAKQWSSFFDDYILSNSVEGIINDFISQLEKEHPKGLVEHVICYMLCGRYSGLAENEILDILVFDKEYWKTFLKTSHEAHRKELEEAGKIPIVVWSRLYLDLELYLTERDANGVHIITFFHRQFVEAIHKRFLKNESRKKKFHKIIEQYFENEIFDIRTGEELTWQLSQWKKWSEKYKKNYLTKLVEKKLIEGNVASEFIISELSQSGWVETIDPIMNKLKNPQNISQIINGMTNNTQPSSRKKIQLKVVGIGSAGLKVLQNLKRKGVPDKYLFAMDWEEFPIYRIQEYDSLLIPVGDFHEGHGWDTVEFHRISFLGSINKIAKIFQDVEHVVIVMGLGGHFCSGVSPLFAAIMKKLGKKIIVIATFPSKYEGKRRIKKAEDCNLLLKNYINAFDITPINNVIELNPSEPIKKLFSLLDELLSRKIIDWFISNGLPFKPETEP